MKVKVAEGIIVDVSCHVTHSCPAGTNYWQVDYSVNGLCIHSATTGAIFGNPDIIAMLDRTFTVKEYHYQDIPNPDKKPDVEIPGVVIKEGEIGNAFDNKKNRPVWWAEYGKTHRQAIIDAYNQLVID
jgi:hypothetical protein